MKHHPEPLVAEIVSPKCVSTILFVPLVMTLGDKKCVERDKWVWVLKECFVLWSVFYSNNSDPKKDSIT